MGRVKKCKFKMAFAMKGGRFRVPLREAVIYVLAEFVR